MKSIKSFSTIVALLLLSGGFACGAQLLNTTFQVLASDPAQTGRLSRAGQPQDWAGNEAFPGVTSTASTFHYKTFTIPAAQLTSGRFVQIFMVDSGAPQGNTFFGAYQNAYLPNSSGSGNLGFDTNWLGDPGTSPNFNFGLLPRTDGVYSQVLVPSGQNLVIPVYNTAAAGLNHNVTLIVENYSDVLYSPPGAPVGPTATPTPTPGPTATPSATPIPTATPTPTPTPGSSEAIAKGSIPAAHNSQASFNIDVTVPPKAKHTVAYSDPANGFSINTTNVTSASVTGNQAHITGTAKLSNGPTVNFTIDLTDGPDHLSISASNGYSNSGNVNGTVIIH